MKKVSLRARLREGAISVLALTALVTILFAVDFRVRAEATRLTGGGSPAGIARGAAQLHADASKLLIAARDKTVQNGPMAASTCRRSRSLLATNRWSAPAPKSKPSSTT